MAESAHSLGYQCEFIDSVLDHFYCKKCSFVARKLAFTTCCGESYCHACIADIQQQDKPCPECGEQNFTTMKPLRHQRQMDSLKVYCSMGKGCSWSGPLNQLDAHLDPEQNHCQYVDIKCPLHCQKIIARNKVDQHVDGECVKRDHVCQYCGFRATYEVVVDTHWPQCIYLPLKCPNFCGVTCERDVMENHMAICRLEEVTCEFGIVGCDGRFRREYKEKHASQNSQKHLSMTASAAVKMNQQLQVKLQEQEEKLQAMENRYEQKYEEQEVRFQEQEQQFLEEKLKTEKELQQQGQKFEKKFEELEEKFLTLLQERDKELQEKSEQNEVTFKDLTNSMPLKRTFAIENFSKEKAKAKDKVYDWKSPVMYTHVCGYKFCVGIDANRGHAGRMGIGVDLWAMQGRYDYQLKWPAQASFTIELLDQHGRRKNMVETLTKVVWEKPTRSCKYIGSWGVLRLVSHLAFPSYNMFLENDTLYFRLSNIDVVT